VSAETESLAENGEVVEGSERELRDIFFALPSEFVGSGGADGQLRHLAADPSQALDIRIVEDLRNFLFDPPGAMDLAAINIQRECDFGIGTLLFAGSGRQTLTGSGGDDHFVFGKGATRATITDFQPGLDKLEFRYAGDLDWRDVHISSAHGHTLVSVGRDQVKLIGVRPYELDKHDFILMDESRFGPPAGVAHVANPI
jgi:Animal haem peroxidase